MTPPFWMTEFGKDSSTRQLRMTMQCPDVWLSRQCPEFGQTENEKFVLYTISNTAGCVSWSGVLSQMY